MFYSGYNYEKVRNLDLSKETIQIIENINSLYKKINSDKTELQKKELLQWNFLSQKRINFSKFSIECTFSLLKITCYQSGLKRLKTTLSFSIHLYVYLFKIYVMVQILENVFSNSKIFTCDGLYSET